jgi:hypothetical protein
LVGNSEELGANDAARRAMSGEAVFCPSTGSVSAPLRVLRALRWSEPYLARSGYASPPSGAVVCGGASSFLSLKKLAKGL